MPSSSHSLRGRPLPLQVRELVRQLIQDEGLCPGDQLPSEPDLAQRFGVGRSTVREAMKLLARDGLIEVVHGRGSFVTALANLRNERPITRFESVSAMLRGLGYDVENRLIGVRTRAATAEEAGELRLTEGAPVIELERVRLQDGKPLVYSINVLDRAAFAGEDLDAIDWTGSVIDLLDARGHRIVSSAAHIRATLPPEPRAASGPALEPGPWLLITETCVTAAGRLVLWAQDYHRGDVFAFHVVRRRPADA